ncbi:MAG: M48 family metalloprotease [Myxococcales bacterium]|nr:M48 family metalloprotease [Myxococcales bacterium]
MLALVLMVLFFATAVAAVVGLVMAGKFLFGLLAEIHGRGVIMIAVAGLACFVAAAVVAWSVLPRPDRFEPPGPEITATRQPELFAELRRVAAATGEAMPVHVYLVNDVNAFVTQRGGLMGVGSRRVMGLGLPLMRTLTVSELRAVIAHEMGHFYGGDTKLGPWIYKTRGSMIRTVINLEKAGEGAAEIHGLIPLLFGAVRAPFVWLAKGFLRVSQAVSRAQEYSADGVAVRTEGAPALIDGLKKTHAAALAHSLYLRNEVEPMIERGVLPPVGEGFSRFLGNDRMTKLLDEVVAAELAEGNQDPYDSHPPLRDRIAAAAQLRGPSKTPDDRPAIALMIEPERYETAAIRALVDRSLADVAWTDVAAHWIAAWRDDAKAARAALTGLTIASLPSAMTALRQRARLIHGEGADHVDDSAIRSWAVGTFGTAIALVLVDAGYQLEADPGAPHRLVDGDVVVEPFTELGAWLRGEAAADALTARFEALGLAERPLA